MVDSATRSITILPNSQNASYIIRHFNDLGSSETILLQPNNPVVCQHNDVLSLLEGKIQFCLRVANEFEMRDDDDPTDIERTLVDNVPQTSAVVAASTHAFQQRQYVHRAPLFGQQPTDNQYQETFELVDPAEIQTVCAVSCAHATFFSLLCVVV